MSFEETTISFGDAFPFRGLAGDPVEVTVDRLVLAGPAAVTAEFSLPWPTWERTVDAGLFHLDDADPPPTFEPGSPVELVARLRSALARDLPAEPDGVVERVVDPDDPLRSTEAWVATELFQELVVPDEREGDDDTVVSVGNKVARTGGVRDPDPGAATVLETVTGVLDAEAFDYEVVHGEPPFVRFDVAVGEDREWSVVVYVDEAARLCTLYSVHPASIPAESRPEAALSAAETNYGLDRGSFAFDPDEGVVDFRTRVLPGAEPFDDALYAHLETMAAAYDEITSITGDESDPGTEDRAEPGENGPG